MNTEIFSHNLLRFSYFCNNINYKPMPLINFQEITKEFTPKEKKYIIPEVHDLLKNRTKDNPIKADQIVEELKNILWNNFKIKFSARILRRAVSYLRCMGIAPIIATHKGYYISNDIEEIDRQIESLTQRQRQNKRTADGLFLYKKTKFNINE